MPAVPCRWSHEAMTNSSRAGGNRGSRVDHALGVFGIVCVAVCVIAGLAFVGYFVLLGVAMSRYGSNK